MGRTGILIGPIVLGFPRKRERPPRQVRRAESGIRLGLLCYVGMNSGIAAEVNCPLCSGEGWTRYVLAPSHYGPESHQVVRCTACGMIYTNPQSRTYLDEVEKR